MFHEHNNDRVRYNLLLTNENCSLLLPNPYLFNKVNDCFFFFFSLSNIRSVALSSMRYMFIYFFICQSAISCGKPGRKFTNEIIWFVVNETMSESALKIGTWLCRLSHVAQSRLTDYTIPHAKPIDACIYGKLHASYFYWLPLYILIRMRTLARLRPRHLCLDTFQLFIQVYAKLMLILCRR